MAIESVTDTGILDAQGNAVYAVSETPITTQKSYTQTIQSTDKAISLADLDLQILDLQIQRRLLSGQDSGGLENDMASVTAERQRNVDIRALMP